jgi:hypothetical protein
VSILDNPELANEFALLAQGKLHDQAGNAEANVLPLLHRTSRQASMQLHDDVLISEVFGAVLDAWKHGYDALRLANYTTASIKSRGAPALVLSMLHYHIALSLGASSY